MSCLRKNIGQVIRLVIPSILVLSLLTVGTPASANPATGSIPVGQSATQVLDTLTVGVKSNASSDRKSHQWNKVVGKTGNYTTRDLVLERDMDNVTYTSRGNVNTGILLEPYTGKTIHFQRGTSNKTEGGSASNRDGGIPSGSQQCEKGRHHSRMGTFQPNVPMRLREPANRHQSQIWADGRPEGT